MVDHPLRERMTHLLLQTEAYFEADGDVMSANVLIARLMESRKAVHKMGGGGGAAGAQRAQGPAQVIRVDEATGGRNRIDASDPWAAASPYKRHRVLTGERVAVSGDFAPTQPRGRLARRSE